MNDKDLDSVFRAGAKAPVNPAAKRKAISAAMAAFAQANTAGAESAPTVASDVAIDRSGYEPAMQATATPTKTAQEKKSLFHQGKNLIFRLIGTTKPNGRRSEMNNTTMKWVYSSVATASLVMFAILIGLQKPRVNDVGSLPKTVPLIISEDKNYAGRAPETTSGKTDVAAVNVPKPSIGAMADTAEMEVFAQQAPARLKEEKYAAEAISKRANKMSPRALADKKIKVQAYVQSQAMAAPGVAAFHLSKRSIVADADLGGVLTPSRQEGSDRFEHTETNPVKLVASEPVSTFSIDVDTASYSFVRRQLNSGVLPQNDAVRVEEMLNYFDYQYPVPKAKSEPFSTTVAVTDSPWKAGNKLLHIGIKGYQVATRLQPKSNLVFLLDVSGSMSSPDKLPLVKQSMSLLLSQLKPDDTVAIVVYAGAAGTVLPPTPVSQKQTIINAMEKLQAGGGTAGAQGIELAYQLAENNFDKNAVNRIILATDGDFNVGIRNRDELKGLVERKREKGIFLSVLGFGLGNYHDHMMQVLAQNGNGVAAYIDTLSEAQKVLVNEATSALFPIAKDVKIQVEFNPATVAEYRLIGYETRHLNREDFNNDKVDAGDIGAGHTVTAIYEISPVNADSALIDPPRYSDTLDKSKSDVKNTSTEYGFLKLRYKLPDQSVSKLVSQVIPSSNSFGKIASGKISSNNPVLEQEISFAAAVAGFAQLLTGGQYTGSWNYDDAIALALANRGDDNFGYRNEFVQLIRKAQVAQ
ncbi:MAG: Ca-activated chloride channel family protein [Lentisphaeria bacterium]|jgi:Ca-activated chloride channel family protein